LPITCCAAVAFAPRLESSICLIAACCGMIVASFAAICPE
jgi:hypothetical protein